jgi:hypothetical protein
VFTVTKRNIGSLTLAAGLALLGGADGSAADESGAEASPLDKAFVLLETYDWGADRAGLNPIDEAIVASHGDAAARQVLEGRLLAVLTGESSRSAKDFVCRKLRTVGTARSVPALAALLPDEELSHMARFALERLPGEEAAKAMRDTLPQVKGRFLFFFGKRRVTPATLQGNLQIGVISSLGARRDVGSVPGLAVLLAQPDPQVACAAAHSLGLIGTPEAAKALSASASEAADSVKPAVADASLACAERLLDDGKKADARALYQSLKGEDQPKHIQVAATKGLLAVAASK